MNQRQAHIEATRKAREEYLKYLEIRERPDGFYIRDSGRDNILGEIPGTFDGPFSSRREAIQAQLGCYFPVFGI